MRIHREGGALVVIEPAAAGSSLAHVPTAGIDAAYRDAGAVLLRGFAGDPAGFRALTERFQERFLAATLIDRSRADADGTTRGVDPGEGEILPHAELSAFPVRPDTAWFYAIEPSAAGGETTLFDGVALLEAVTPETRAVLASKRITASTPTLRHFWRHVPEPVDEITAARAAFEAYPDTTCEIENDVLIVHHTSKLVERVRDRAADALLVHHDFLIGLCRFEDGSRVPKAVREDTLRALRGLEVAVAWQPNDVLMVDNTRFMHGRRPFQGTRRILARFGYGAPRPSARSEGRLR